MGLISKIAAFLREEVVGALRSHRRARWIFVLGAVVGVLLVVLIYHGIKIKLVYVLWCGLAAALFAIGKYVIIPFADRPDQPDQTNYADQRYQEAIVDQVQELQASLVELAQLNRDFADELSKNSELATPGRNACLQQSQDIVSALAGRIVKIEATTYDKAVALLHEKVEIQKSFLAPEIQAPPIPPFAPIDCKSCLEQLKAMLLREIASLKSPPTKPE